MSVKQISRIATRATSHRIGVIDIFAGPGGLGEGFSSFSSAGTPFFKIGVSAEKEPSAHATLRLRAFYRMLRDLEGELPRDYLEFLRKRAANPKADPGEFFSAGRHRHLWVEAEREAKNLTLGEGAHDTELRESISRLRKHHDELVLIGGPPCQAYSLVGRARQRSVPGFRSRGDERHFLYRHYLGLLAEFKPAVFIMENVRGILSSTVGGKRMWTQILEDLANPTRSSKTLVPSSDEYVLMPIHVEVGTTRDPELAARNPKSFVLRCERHGVPQARHRVIIMGIRRDFVARALALPGLAESKPVSVSAALSGLAKLRSGLSKKDSDRSWGMAVDRERKALSSSLARSDPETSRAIKETVIGASRARESNRYAGIGNEYTSRLRHRDLDVVLNHQTRGHMERDLGRYLYCSAYGQAHDSSPKAKQFPARLRPNHANWDTGDFSDRFRVQLAHDPADTVTSHLSKDGHAFIHWDPSQCRSLTVREAARLQSFADDYLFLGNRTQQYVQVGNAVPPLVALQIAGVVAGVIAPQE